MVGVRRFELLTSSVSGKRSPPELNARISAAGVAARSILRENAHVTQPSIASFSRITNTAQREGRWAPASAALLALQMPSPSPGEKDGGCKTAAIVHTKNDREVFSATFSQETGSDRSFWCALLGGGTPEKGLARRVGRLQPSPFSPPLRRIAPFLKTTSAQLGKCRGRLRKGAILREKGAGRAPATSRAPATGGALAADRAPRRPPNQTCGLIAVHREGPAHLPAVLLGNVVARVLLTRRFPGGGLTARPAQDKSLPRASKRRPKGNFGRNPC